MIQEVMKGLINKGHKNTLFTAKFPNCQNLEIIDDIEIIRDGGKYSVYDKARRYILANSERYDVIIDSINTKPFLTPKFVTTKPIIALFYQLAREFWFYETRFPINIIGYYILEKKWLSHYKNIPTVTISNHQAMNLSEAGFEKNLYLKGWLKRYSFILHSRKGECADNHFRWKIEKGKASGTCFESLFDNKGKDS